MLPVSLPGFAKPGAPQRNCTPPDGSNYLDIALRMLSWNVPCYLRRFSLSHPVKENVNEGC